jgi:hypothetical protein
VFRPIKSAEQDFNVQVVEVVQVVDVIARCFCLSSQTLIAPTSRCERSGHLRIYPTRLIAYNRLKILVFMVNKGRCLFDLFIQSLFRSGVASAHPSCASALRLPRVSHGWYAGYWSVSQPLR